MSSFSGFGIIAADVVANRPAATAVGIGALFAATDEGKIYRSNGTSWDAWHTTSAGAPGLHAATHEVGGTDKINVGGLSGLLADAQTPLAHTHTEADVTGLVGDLSALAAADTALDSRVDALEVSSPPPEAQGTWLVSGGSVVFLQDYDFRVSAASYYINGAPFTSPQTDITLDPADATNDRFDAIVVNTSGVVTKVTGTAASNPALPDIDPETQLALTYIFVQALSTAPSGITITDIYKEDAEWTSSVSGGFNAASTNNPFAGTKDIEATAAVTGDFVRLTNGAAISLADQKQLVINIRSKASWPNPKSLQITWYNAGVKKGQSVPLGNSKYGFDSANTASYQQIVIPLSAFGVSAVDTVDRLEFKVSGGGGSIGFYLDNISLESGSSDVTPPSIGAATASVLGLIRTDVTDANPQVYLKASVDTLLAGKSAVGHTHALDNLSDVDPTGKTVGDLLSWNGTDWVPTSSGSIIGEPFGVAFAFGDGLVAPGAGSILVVTMLFAGDLVGWYGRLDVSGSATFTIKKATGATGALSSIGGTMPSISSALGASGTPTSTSFAVGDQVAVSLDTITTALQATLTLGFVRA